MSNSEQWGLSPALGGRPTIKTRTSLEEAKNTTNTMERRRSSQTSETGHHGVSASGELPEDRRGSSHDRPLVRTLSGTRSRSSSGSSTSSGSSAGSRKSRKSGTSPGQHRNGEEGQWLACVSTPSDGASSTASTAGIYNVLEQDHRMDVAVSPRNIMRRSMRNPTGRLSERCEEADIKSDHEGEDADGRKPILCQDYDYLASEYRRMAQYRDLAGSQLCAMCLKKSCEDVLFPCQHKCICPDCMKTNDIGDVFTKGKWAQCPVCCGDIKRIIRHNGHEVQDYWKWVLDIRPTLPAAFEYRFERVGKSLRKRVGKMLAADEEPEHDEGLEEFAEQCRNEFQMGYNFEEPEDPAKSCACSIA